MSAGSIPARANSSPVPVDGIELRGAEQPALAGELAGRHVAAAGERVVGRGDDDQPAAQERHRGDRRRALGRRRRPEHDVGAAVLEQLRRRRAGDGFDRDLEPGIPRREGVDHRPDMLGDDVRHRHLHQPRAAGAVVHGPARLLGERQDLRRQRRQPAAAGGQPDRPSVTDEQLVAELLAQRRDRNRHGGFGHAQLGGGRLDRPQPRDEHERLQLGERHLSREAYASAVACPVS